MNVCWAQGFRELYAIENLPFLESFPEKKLEEVYDRGLNNWLIMLNRLKKAKISKLGI